MTTARRIAKNSVAITLSGVINWVLSLLFGIVVARYLGRVGLGQYSFALAYVSLFGILAGFGLDPLLIREVAKNKAQANKYLSNSVTIKVVLSFLMFGLIYVTINIADRPMTTKLAVYIASLSLLCNGIITSLESLFQAFERMEFIPLAQTAANLTKFLLTFIALTGGYQVLTVVTIFLLSTVVQLGIDLYLVERRIVKIKFEPNLAFMKDLLRESYPFMLAAILTVIFAKIDVIILSQMKGEASVGVYTAGYSLFEMLRFIPAGYIGSIYPVISQFFEHSPDSLMLLYRKSFRYLFYLSLPIAVGTTLLAKRFILLVYGPEFISSVLVLQIVIWSTLFFFENFLLGHVIFAIGEQKSLIGVKVSLVIINVTLNLILIPYYAEVGAGFATLISYCASFAMHFWLLSKYIDRIHISVTNLLLKPAIAALFMSLTVRLFYASNMLLLIPLTASVYVASLFLLRAFEREDICLLKKAVIGSV